VDTDPTKRKHLDWVQRYNTILGDWSGSWASLPPRRFSTPKLFIGILQQATLEWVYGTRTCYEGASMGIIERMKCCWDYISNNNCNMRRRACVEMHSCWSFVYAKDASLRPKAVYNQFSLMLSRDSVMLQDSTKSFCVRRVCELSWHWAMGIITPLPQFHLILQSLFVWVIVGSGSLHSYHFGEQYTVCLLSTVEYPTMYTSPTVTFNAVQQTVYC